MLRMRRVGDRRLQTIKAGNSAFERGEWEAEGMKSASASISRPCRVAGGSGIASDHPGDLRPTDGVISRFSPS
jgi:hypothetical protein